MEDKKEQVMQWLVDTLSQTKGFILEQAPDVVQQYIGYAIMGELPVAQCLGFILASVTAFILFRIGKTKDYTEQEGYYAIGSVSALVALVCLIFSFLQVIHILQIHLYPKAYLLDKFIL